MSFINHDATSTVYAPGYFLAHDEDCRRETKEIPQSIGTTKGSTKYVKMGTPYPSNDANIEGFVYEDVDVTSGNMPGSVVTQGAIYESRIPVQLTSTARTKIENLGFVLASILPVGRPY